jgi:hypothetical protein
MFCSASTTESMTDLAAAGEAAAAAETTEKQAIVSQKNTRYGPLKAVIGH